MKNHNNFRFFRWVMLLDLTIPSMPEEIMCTFIAEGSYSLTLNNVWLMHRYTHETFKGSKSNYMVFNLKKNKQNQTFNF